MTALYSSVGERLTHYEVAVDRPALNRKSTVTLPAGVQYAWPHPSQPYLYVVSSNGGPRAAGDEHYASAFSIGTTGALRAHGAPQPLPSRPLHVSLDATGSFALVTYNRPSRITVHRIDPDGTFGAEVEQARTLDFGVYAHQTLVMPSNRAAILVTRGNDAARGKSEEPGALKLFDFRDGVLTNKTSIAPGGGHGFGPRHLDYHPTRPWVYVSLERQNKLCMFELEGDGFAPEPTFVEETLRAPGHVRPWQMAGAIHMHPSGKFVYVANRAHFTVEFEGSRIFGGGENTIAVYSIDQSTGEPTLIQAVDTRGFHVRTFALDPGGRVLVAASLVPLQVREATRIATVPAGLSVFSVREDGQLAFVRKYDVETGGKTQFWAGIVKW